MLRNAGGWGVHFFSRKKHYEGVWFNVISVTRRWVGGGGPISKKKTLRNTWMAP